MSVFKGFLSGLRAYAAAVSFSREHGLWPHYWRSAVFGLLVFAAVGGLAIVSGLWLSEWLDSWLLVGMDEGSAWGRAVAWLLRLLVFLLTLYAYVKLYAFVMLSTLSALVGPLVEACEQALTGRDPAPTTTLRSLRRGVALTARNTLFELLIALSLTVLAFFVPLLAPVAPALAVGVQSFYMGFGAIDPGNEYRGLGGKESLAMARRQRGFAVGCGLAFAGLLLVPVIGVMLAPPLSVVAASVGYHRFGVAEREAALTKKKPEA